jgi:DnaJ-class molecular chaperone
MKSYYDALGVSKSATKAEIKAAFRKLSLETHPDVAQGGNLERFKQLNEAHRVLSNASERRIYDAEIMDPHRWELRRNRGDSGFRHAGSKRPMEHSSFMHAFFDGLGRPRNIALGLTIGFSTMVAIKFAFGTDERPVTDTSAQRVEAWYNPETKQWEPPAPWDPKYRQLKPTLQFMPREQVRHRPFH